MTSFKSYNKLSHTNKNIRREEGANITMIFAYRIRFHFCEGNMLNSDQHYVEFNIDKHTYRLKAAVGKSLKETNEVVLNCSGFETEEEAFLQGRKLQKCLSVCGAMLKRGIDVGKEKTLTGSSQYLKEIAEKQGVQLINDVHGLSVYRDDIETKVITGLAPTVVVSFKTEKFISTLENAYSLAPEFTEMEKIAFDLYNSSYFETTPTARFLTLVSAVETMSKIDNMEEEVIKLIDNLITLSKQSKLDKKNKNSVVNRLRILKKQSISASTRQLIQKYLGEDESRLFSKIYNIRSGLLHDGVLRCNANEFAEKLKQLEKMVSQLLLNTIEAKPPNNELSSAVISQRNKM